MRYFLAAAIAPFVMLFIKAVALWLVRRFVPRWERVLFTPIQRL